MSEMLTKQELDTLEAAWEILNDNRHCSDFNESHDLNISDGCRLLSEFLNYTYEKLGKQHTSKLTEQLQILESFRNL